MLGASPNLPEQRFFRVQFRIQDSRKVWYIFARKDREIGNRGSGRLFRPIPIPIPHPWGGGGLGVGPGHPQLASDIV